MININPDMIRTKGVCCFSGLIYKLEPSVEGTSIRTLSLSSRMVAITIAAVTNQRRHAAPQHNVAAHPLTAKSTLPVIDRQGEYVADVHLS